MALPPLVARWICPECGTRNEADCTSHYYSNPIVGPNVPFKVFPIACFSCSVKGEVRVRLIEFLRSWPFVVREMLLCFPEHEGWRVIF